MPTNPTQSWMQTVVVLLAVATASASMSLWVSSSTRELSDRLLEVEYQLKALSGRVIQSGWSFRQQVLWSEELRKGVKFNVPSPAQFPPGKMNE